VRTSTKSVIALPLSTRLSTLWGREAAVGTGFAAKGRRSRDFVRLLNSRLTRERNSGQLFLGGLLGLRRGSSSSFLIPFALALLTTSQTVQAAATSPAPPSQSPAGCGATIEDNLAAAQKAMQSDDKATRAALACLIEATAALNRQVQNLDQGRSPAGALRVPTMTFPPARDQ
jgi:hypothetical protein